MPTHSSILAWRIPWTEEPGGLLVHGVAKTSTWLKWLSTAWKIKLTAEKVNRLKKNRTVKPRWGMENMKYCCDSESLHGLSHVIHLLLSQVYNGLKSIKQWGLLKGKKEMSLT